MHDVDIELLKDLLTVLREYRVDEFHQGELHIVLSKAGAPASTQTVQSPSEPKRAAYEALFRGKPPTFEQYKDAGLPMAEG